MSPYTPSPRASRRAPRSPGVVALLGLFALLLLTICQSKLQTLTRPSAGFAFHQHLSGEVEAIAITAPAARATEGERDWRVLAVNRQPVTSDRRALAKIARSLDVRPQASNEFELQSPRGQRRHVSLEVSMPRFVHLYLSSPETVLYPLVGLLYVALGLWVWWKRPEDRAATPMLIMTLAAASVLGCSFGVDLAAVWTMRWEHVVLPLYAPALVHFGLKFTGYHPRRRLLTRVVLLAALALGAFEFLYSGANPAAFRLAQVAIGALLAGSVVVTTRLGLRVARSPSPLALQRRGRLLAKTSLVAFFIPTLTVILPDVPGEWVVVVGLLLTFPMAMAYAIIRHGVFNFRVVLRQGLVHALLSVGVLIAYLALTLAALRLAHLNDHKLGSLTLAAVLVLGSSLLELRLQRAVNQFVFRSRDVFGDAVALASAQLANAKTRAAVMDVVREALLGKLELSRAALATAESGATAWHCSSLRPESKAAGADSPAQLPSQLWPARYAPLRRALASQAIVTAYDSAAASAQGAHERRPRRSPAAAEPAAQGDDEATFWTHFGFHAIVPLAVGTESLESRVVGLLLLGPKVEGRPLDSADERLVLTLAHQLAVAVENASAFDEIRSLKDGLERQVAERTRDLSNALTDLQRAQGQLIESEKQAMLGRLVAGMAHEINTPLGTLRSSVDTLRRIVHGGPRGVASGIAVRSSVDGWAPPSSRSDTAIDGLLEVMTSSAERLHQLVSRLKRFVSLDRATHQQLDLRESIDSALSVLGPSLTPEITIRQNYSDSDLSLQGDRAKLNQLFWNLLQNSLTALNGRGEIRIEARRDADQIEVDLSDNGIGIAEERLHDVFDFGFSQKNGRVGLRLGLPTSKLTVDELGGEISIESSPGRGTSVRLRLPVKPPSSASASFGERVA